MNSAIDELKSRYPWPNECPDRPYFMHGWLSEDVKRGLLNLGALLSGPFLTILEIGTWLGKSAEFLLQHYQVSELITVDTFQGSPEHHKRPEWNEILNAGLEEQAIRNLWLYKDRCTIVKRDSHRAINELRQIGIQPDIVYVDGSHEYHDVLNDVGMSLHSFPDAIICGDDLYWRGVESALILLRRRKKIKVDCDGAFWRILR